MKLKIYLKSGNSILLDNVKEYEIKNKGNIIVGMSIVTKSKPKQKLLVKTIDLSSIEAVTVIKKRFTL